MNKLYFSLVFLFFGSFLFAGPGTYYNTLDSTVSCSSFKNKLFNLIKNDSHLSYRVIDNYYNRTDVKNNEIGTGIVILDRYSSENPTGIDYCAFDTVAGFCGNNSSSVYCGCYNKEHVIPTSWYNASGNTPINEISRTDMHYVWPADTKMNIAKSNLPLGYVQSATQSSLNGTKIGSSNSTLNYSYNKSTVFEPIDSFKGDFARAYLYFAVRYQDSLSAWNRNNIAQDVFTSGTYPGLESWILQLCMQWHKMDPPSTFERLRNDSVFAIQGNRNPFIDFPHWAEKIFGPDGAAASCVNTGIRTQQTATLEVYPNPVQDALTIELSAAFVLENTTIQITDMLGRVLYMETWKGNARPVIATSFLEKGMYVIRVESEENSAVTTFIRQ